MIRPRIPAVMSASMTKNTLRVVSWDPDSDAFAFMFVRSGATLGPATSGVATGTSAGTSTGTMAGGISIVGCAIGTEGGLGGADPVDSGVEITGGTAAAVFDFGGVAVVLY